VVSPSQAAWVARVLGIVTGDAAAPLPKLDYLGLWRDAKEEVDAGLNRLASELRATADEDLVRIADYGLFGLTNGQGVGLVKALMQLRQVAPDRRPAAVKAARDAAAAYRQAVLGHPLAALVDENPFGIPVGLRSRLVAALDTIADAA
jgi:hypothetical protein